MQRRTSLKLLGAAGAGIAGLVLVDWKWQILDRLTHAGFFTYDQERLISSLAETLIPEGIPGGSVAAPIGALSTGTDQFLPSLDDIKHASPLVNCPAAIQVDLL